MASILDKTQQYVFKTLNERLSHKYLYHNYSHTQRVVKHVKELIAAENLSEEDAELLELAAWFHDIGFVEGGEGHEEKGALLAKEFLAAEAYPDDKIKTIQDCIRATKMGVTPKTLLQKMLCDADFSHFSSKNYGEVSSLLRGELEQLGISSYTDSQWVEENIKMFLEHHKFYTKTAAELWQPQKNKNLVQLNRALRKIKEKKKVKKRKSAELERKVAKEKRPDRGVETMYRVTLRNHIKLSDIADTKANILLSVNAIIISLALANLIPKLDNPSNTYLIWPTLIFLVFSLISMGLSVLATRPNVTTGRFNREDVKQKKVNLLFFGNFHQMKLEDFEWAMNELIQDKEYLYSSMSKDLYFLGKVLHRKYKILRFTYAIFMIGIAVSVIAFAVSFKMYGN
ncbi:Pycsar system effector family protein [Sungkyunkwania multivorans]|uniref:Pycsar system effector family protein n=1 Tax=Sungkyunkwania multivorans TaxID=1173618 RepID=A0ABW3D0B0_9FLAO